MLQARAPDYASPHLPSLRHPPALQRLLADIEEGLIDVVVVYKIDRLSRSLMDFSKLVEVFDRNDVTFVSITQSFNTTTSMGRLTLNILLSFAQFEREVTAERIRDKFAASRAKGIFMGGVPPLGYDVQSRKLIVNEAAAANVRYIFQRFSEVGSGTTILRELAQRGITTRQGKPITKGFLYRLLNNRAYLGEAVHKGKSYSGRTGGRPTLYLGLHFFIGFGRCSHGYGGGGKRPYLVAITRWQNLCGMGGSGERFIGIRCDYAGLAARLARITRTIVLAMGSTGWMRVDFCGSTGVQRRKYYPEKCIKSSPLRGRFESG